LDTQRRRVFNRDGATFPVDPRHWQSIVGIDLDTKVGSYVVAFDGLSRGKSISAVKSLKIEPRQFGIRVLHVDEAFVHPPPPVAARISAEAREMEGLWTQSAAHRLWSEGFVRPVSGAANAAFGSRSVFNGERRQPHAGADFMSPAGTPVRAPNGGHVVLARDLYFTGNTVVIDHGLGVFSLLAHLSSIDVHEGAAVIR